jgi:hypothetical protein
MDGCDVRGGALERPTYLRIDLSKRVGADFSRYLEVLDHDAVELDRQSAERGIAARAHASQDGGGSLAHGVVR